ncbi:ADP-ribosyltransferase [Bacillus thuringiensis]|uniref:ADP-ribosyltransferase n=1 Tax=Bacillus thuringiensis TaxID=1428 RepID=UPI003BF6CB28
MKKKTATALALSLGILASSSIVNMPTAMAAPAIDFQQDTSQAETWSSDFNKKFTARLQGYEISYLSQYFAQSTPTTPSPFYDRVNKFLERGVQDPGFHRDTLAGIDYLDQALERGLYMNTEERTLYKKVTLDDLNALNIPSLKKYTDLIKADGKINSETFLELQDTVAEKDPIIKYKSYLTTGLTVNSIFSAKEPIIYRIKVPAATEIAGDPRSGSKSLAMLLPRNSSIQLTSVGLINLDGKTCVQISAEIVR